MSDSHEQSDRHAASRRCTQTPPEVLSAMNEIDTNYGRREQQGTGITLDQVPVFCIISGVGHIVIRAIVIRAEDHGDWLAWAYTACGTLISGADKSTTRPTRLCRKCRARLGDLTRGAAAERT